jgi:hypothetical protein
MPKVTKVTGYEAVFLTWCENAMSFFKRDGGALHDVVAAMTDRA